MLSCKIELPQQPFEITERLPHRTLDTRLGSSFHQKKQHKQYIYILTDTQKRTIGLFYPFVRFFVYGQFVCAFRLVMSKRII